LTAFRDKPDGFPKGNTAGVHAVTLQGVYAVMGSEVLRNDHVRDSPAVTGNGTVPVAGWLGTGATLACLSACRGAELDPAGPVSAAERTILYDALAMMLAIVIPVIIATLLIAFHYRATNTAAQYRPTFTHSGRIELIIWSIPALVIFFLGGVAWTSSFMLDPARPLATTVKPIEIQVVSLDWKWLFIYPEQRVASVNRLVVPTGVPLHLRLTSASVWNVFWVPQLGSMLYCMHGMAGTLYLQADRPGVYQGQSAMISGDGFADMHFDTDAVASDEFAKWVSATQGAGPALDTAAYQALLRQSSNVSPYTYSSVRPGLFEAIVTQELPPGEGPLTAPAPGQLATAVSR
jgi:cytochrome o ubiquinol oxidase subunit 2